MNPTVVCVGQTTLDHVWTTSSPLAVGGKQRADRFHSQGGGIAANAAVVLARLGATVSLWTRAGDDAAGHTMREELRAHNVDTTHFHTERGAQSSVSSILVDGHGQRTIVNFRGAGFSPVLGSVPRASILAADAVLADPRWFDAALAAFLLAREANIPTVLDAEIAERDVIAALLPLADYPIFSESSLRLFCGDGLTPDDALRALYQPRMHLIAVTTGEHGVRWFDGHSSHHLPAFSVPILDTTGAGDVFHGAFTFALVRGDDTSTAMRFASACAALKCRHAGGRNGIPTAHEVAQFLATVAT